MYNIQRNSLSNMGSLPNKLYSEQVICLSLGIVESSVYLYSLSIAMAHNVLILLYNGRYSIHICTILMAIIRRQWRKCCTTWSYLKISITNFSSPTSPLSRRKKKRPTLAKCLSGRVESCVHFLTWNSYIIRGGSQSCPYKRRV